MLCDYALVNDVSALIGALAALIAAIAGLLRALKPLLPLRHDKTRDQEAESPAVPTASRSHVSRRTTWSLSLGLLAAILAVVLVVLVSLANAASRPVVGVVFLAAIGILAWPGAALGIERAWTARSTDRRLAINAAAGTLVGLTAWISALIVTAPNWG